MCDYHHIANSSKEKNKKNLSCFLRSLNNFKKCGLLTEYYYG